ncbi:MAG TPA: DUF4160 domain-containing protein [Bacteroidia bacterium]|jgi:hypothetical protein|nr:DUF4160 domain-containing protein [Bacteroidia bacterium]HQF27991.1 DUF4160 domain-containing protein [Bacteroidia bacterium]HQK96396.1 DUF4160 domain-containing protein [Bacteroidia bacterium]
MTPRIASFNGVHVHIYSREHLPPHIHVICGDDEAIIRISDAVVLRGRLENSKLTMIRKWMQNRVVANELENYFFALNPHLKRTKDLKYETN